MKKVVMVIFCLLLLASAGLVGMSCDDDEVEVTWRLATFSMENTPETDMLYAFADKVEDESDGRMEIQVFPGGSLYQMNEIFDAVSSDAIDLGLAGVTSYFSKAPKTASIISYANVTASNAEEAVALGSALDDQSPLMKQEATANGITHLIWAPVGAIGCFFKEPVDELSDMDGMLVGCTSGVIPIAQAWGCSPKEMEFADFYLNAQTGVVDAWLFAPFADYIKMGLYDVAPYVVNLNFQTTFSVFMSQSSFDDLPEDLQEVVLDVASEIQSDWLADINQADEDIFQELVDNPDVEYIYDLTGAERTTWFETAIQPVFYGMMTQFMSETEIADTVAIIESVLASLH